MSSILEAAQADRRPPPPKPLPADTQQVCIDLPGEEIRCYIYKPKLQIMLRKHRDVIFDIEMFKGMQYTVEADQSDFYNARDKKIVLFKRQQKVTFADGERMHLWVGREFKGALILKAAGKVLGRYTPNELDPVRYDADPATKPAPLIISMKNQPDAEPSGSWSATSAPAPGGDDAFMGWSLKPALSAYGVDRTTFYSRDRPSIPVTEHHPTVAVVEGTDKGMPAQLVDFFAKGGGKSGLADVDPNEVATRNWLLGQLAGGAAYVGDNWNWLRHSINRQADGTFKLVSAKVAYVRGKVRIYFSGYNARNPVFGPGGHGSGNAKILQIYAGVGRVGSAFKATTQAVAGTFKGNALASFIFGSFTAWTEWQADTQKDGYDFAAALLTGLAKAILAAALTTAFVAVVLMFVIGIAKVGVAALVVGLFTLAVGFALNYIVEAGDKALGRALKGQGNSDGTAAVVAPWLRTAGRWIEDSWNQLSLKFPKDYQPWAAL
jgi:hypothetical protein